jgi:hypothetical protein
MTNKDNRQWPSADMMKELAIQLSNLNDGVEVKPTLRTYLFVGTNDYSLHNKHHIQYQWTDSDTTYTVWTITDIGKPCVVPLGWKAVASHTYSDD